MNISPSSTHLGKVLLIEDDPKFSQLTARFLELHGFDVNLVFHWSDAVEGVRRHDPAITMLDLKLPDHDSLQLCRDLRAFSSMPILMLSATQDYRSQVLALESGADDYVVKPVKPLVLLARIRALLRRPNRMAQPPDRLEFASLIIDRRSLSAKLRSGPNVPLSTTEFATLWALASQAGKVLSRQELIEAISNSANQGSGRRIDVYVSKLRSKLGEGSLSASCIKTIRGGGYVFVPMPPGTNDS